MSETIENYRAQIALARTEIKNLRLQLCALKHEHFKEIKHIKNMLSTLRCGSCNDAATTVATASNEDAASATNADAIPYRPIGYIETPFHNKRGVPRQPTVMAQAKGAVVIDTNVFSNPEHALSGLEEFSHIWILFHFHQTDSNSVPAKVSPPRLRGERRGVFSTRSPHRPCPIGISLVKIQSIEGNKINFLGVDMVNGTPVLDIKPYIPQYDYPVPQGPSIPSLVRPPTEGTSDATTNDVQYDDGSLSPRLTNPIGVETNPPTNQFNNLSTDQSNITPNTPSPESPSSVDLLDGNYQTPNRPDTERGAPDGQERYTPPQSAHLTTITHDGVRVASWISNPPSQTYEVRFTEDALQRLNDLIGERAQTFKSNIECLLFEDPRSKYVRNKYPDHEYSCVLEDLSISCIFDSSTSICTIVAVRNAEDLQT